MFKEIREGIANAITSDIFPVGLIVGMLCFLLGIICGYATSEDIKMQQCDEMSITESLKYPYCRDYLERALEEMTNE